jgi:hypothetical protein
VGENRVSLGGSRYGGRVHDAVGVGNPAPGEVWAWDWILFCGGVLGWGWAGGSGVRSNVWLAEGEGGC